MMPAILPLRSGAIRPAALPRPKGARLGGLDGLRGLAALGVALFYHDRLIFTPAALARQGAAMAFVHQWGWALVDLFFVLSGFVFAQAYLARGGSAGWRGWSAFWVARVARLWPLHLLMLGATALLLPRPENTPAAFAAHLVMAQAFVGPVAASFDGPSWSLSVEAVCYLAFSLAMLGGRGVALRAALVLALGAGLWLALMDRPGGPWNAEVLPRALLGFFAGQLLWRLRQARAWQAVPGAAWLALSALGLALAVGQGAHTPLPALTLLAWPALFMAALKSRWMEAAPMLWLGRRSYAVYLLHGPLLDLYARHLPLLNTGAAGQWLVRGVLALVLLALAEASGRWLEEPAARAIRQAGQRWLRPAPGLFPA